jgi:hypothetical protein
MFWTGLHVLMYAVRSGATFIFGLVVAVASAASVEASRRTRCWLSGVRHGGRRWGTRAARESMASPSSSNGIRNGVQTQVFLDWAVCVRLGFRTRGTRSRRRASSSSSFSQIHVWF